MSIASNEDQPPRNPSKWLRIRAPISSVKSLALGILCIAVCFGLWWLLTLGEPEERIVGPLTVPSPAETIETFPSLWQERALARNMLVTLRRVLIGFSLAIAVGVPLGVLAGCFSPIRSFLAPLIIFGRNIPLAALIPLTFFFFGIGESQKVMFIFIACVAFIIADTATAVMEVSRSYIDTAYTLGANRMQVILKVLVPLSLPSVFNSARVLFGLAFGYIMLAELIRFGDEIGGLGNLILISQKRGPREHIFLIVLIIPVIALLLDRILFWMQRELFPHRYGGAGILNQLVRVVLHGWDDLKSICFRQSAVTDGTATTVESK